MRRPYSSQVENQQLQVQELVVRFADTQLMAQSVASHSIIVFHEPLAAVVCCLLVDDDVAATQTVPAASMTIVNSSDYGPNGQVFAPSPFGRDHAGNAVPAPGLNNGQYVNDAVKIANTQLAPNDCFILKYISVR
jgi:hypothetical protein